MTVRVGCKEWWRDRQAQGGPAVSRDETGSCTVTFFWRDPAGDEQASSTRRVWIYITGVTDHHQRSRPRSLVRIPGTDVWQWQTRLGSAWRGTYCLIPSANEHDFPAAAFVGEVPDLIALREGWRKLLPRAIADPLNPDSWKGGRGHPVSALHLPASPPQAGWDKPAAAWAAPQCIIWRSQRLKNKRRVWLFCSGESAPERRPLAIVLDGQFWAQSLPVWPAIQAQTNAGALPEAVYLLIDVIDDRHRSRELPCNPDFWLAVQQELLPMLRERAVWNHDPQTTVVAGQSFGGLSSLYAGLHWPETFGCVLSQSGSYWWPKRDADGRDGLLIKQLEKGEIQPKPLRIYLEAGLREPLIHRVNQRLYPLLQQTQQAVFYRQVDGGHDALCWRGGLIDGLAWLWKAS